MAEQPKIKLLIFVPTLECGGMEKYIWLLCNNINTAIFDVTLAVLNNAHPFFVIQNKAVKVVDLHVPHVRFAIFKIRATIKKTGPDIVFTTGNHLNLYMAVFRWAISRKIKVVSRESSIVSINNRRAKFPLFYDWLAKKCYADLDLVMSQSVYMEKDLIDKYHIAPGRSVVIYNPVEDPMIKAKEINNSKETVYKFITVARLSEEKGVSRLIASVALFPHPFVYYIIGEGRMHASLQKQIDALQLQDKIFLTGRKEDPFAGMEDAHLFLMGSLYEGLGNVLLEAGARGIPVVAFDAPGGIGEVVIEGKNGVLVEDNNTITFALGIEKAIATQFDRQQIAEITQQRFSVSAIITRVEALFIQLYRSL